MKIPFFFFRPCCLILMLLLLWMATRQSSRRPLLAYAFRVSGTGFLSRHSAREYSSLLPARQRLVGLHNDGFSSGTSRTREVFSSTRGELDAAENRNVQEASHQEQIDRIILHDLNPSQIQAVTQPARAITRVIAGPGSGKTRVLISRIAYLLQQPHQQHTRILGVTFTRKAAGEMQQRLQKLLTVTTVATNSETVDAADMMVAEDTDENYPHQLDRVTLGTFHSICAKILRWNGGMLSTLPLVVSGIGSNQNATLLDGNFAIVDQAGQLQTLRECLKEAEIDLQKYDVKPLPVLTAIGQCKDMQAQGVDPLLPPKSNEKPETKALKVAKRIYRRYREKLLASNCIDFDDIMYLTRELLLHNADVRERLQMRWTHILVDEYQDTSRSQMDLVKLLTSTSLFVVGDADQSIYSWRGAHAGSLSDFDDEFRDFGSVSTVYLMENYRSTSNIVEAAQKVISRSGDSVSGADKLRQDMKPKRGAGPSPRVIACKDDRAEAEFVIKTIKERLVSGAYGSSHTVALIYRTNSQSRALEEACVKQNLPYVIFGTATSFYKRHEVKDCLCFLRWMHNGRDRTAMLRAMGTPARGIGDTAIRQFDFYCQHMEELVLKNAGSPVPSPFDVLMSFSGKTSLVPSDVDPSSFLSTRALKHLTEFSGQLRSIVDIAMHKPVEQVLSSIINELELIPHLDKISKSNAEFEERKRNVEELQLASQRYSKDGPCLVVPKNADGGEFKQSPLGTFLDDISLVTDMVEKTESSTDDRFVANLMTIHASKGMEFDAVFLVGNEEGTLPTSQAIQEGEGSVKLEEEKRLCYVAMTRAKTELFLTWRQEVSVFVPEGIRTVKGIRSRFLDILLQKKGTASVQTPRTPLRSEGSSRYAERNTKKGQSYTTRKQFGSPGPLSYASNSPHKPALKFEGTTSVLGKQRRFPFDLPSSQITNPSRQPHRSNVAQNTQRSNAPKEVSPKNGAQQVPSQVTARLERLDSTPERRESTRSPPRISKSATKESEKKFDSTWIYPVGSEVMHRDLGKGVVLRPPAHEGEFVVRVQFGNGGKRDFPVHGTDLSPIVL